MNDFSLGVVESRFADIIWANAPLSTQRLVQLCEAELQWKRTTTYTVLKRLAERGLFRNEGGQVTALLSREEFYARRSQQFVEESFGGSLPAFLAAFGTRKQLSDAEVDELKKLIEGMRR